MGAFSLAYDRRQLPRWATPHPSAKTSWRTGYPDDTAHRIISDLSAFIGNGRPSTHRILAVGDLNMAYGSVSDNPHDLIERQRSVFGRMKAIGLELVGPQQSAGRTATPTPTYLPADTRNVPTYDSATISPADAHMQLDYVFASRGFHEGARARRSG